jgi:hypothetical protein
MENLPIDIWECIFSHLNDSSDFLKSQLICRATNQNSTRKLYSDIHIKSEIQARLFIRTIKNSTILTPLVTSVTSSGAENWKSEDLFDNVMVYCPNVVKIDPHFHYMSLWLRLIHAACNNQLQYLEYLPSPNPSSMESMELYYLAAQAFHRSLKRLLLTTDQSLYQSDNGLILAKPYNNMLKCLTSFSNVVEITLYHHSNQGILYLDSIIEKLPRLKKLDASVYPSTIVEKVVSTFDLTSVEPRPDIKTLKCK